MKKTIVFILVSLSILLLACQTTSNPISENELKEQEKIENVVSGKMLFSGDTKYSLIFNDAKGTIGYYSDKQNSLADEELNIVMLESNTVNEPGSAKLKTVASAQPVFMVNGMSADELRNAYQTGSSNIQRAKGVSNPLFGNEVTFSLRHADNAGIQKSAAAPSAATTASEVNLTMYVPEQVHITSPNIETAEDLLPYCYYKDFKLKWNADPQNENGLVVVVEWAGTDMYGKRYGKVVRNADIIPYDNGEWVLNDELFDDMPQGALAKLLLVRGNIEMVTDFVNEVGEEDVYRVVAASEAILPFILVRNIE